MRPEERLTMNEQAEAVRVPSTICPDCKAPRFYATTTYYLVDGTKRRLRKCWKCGHAVSESVPRPIVDGDEPIENRHDKGEVI